MSKFKNFINEGKKPSKVNLEDIIRSMQLYLGSLDYTRIRDQEKLRNKLDKKLERIAKITGMDISDIWDQTETIAKRRGVIRPQPGKDI